MKDNIHETWTFERKLETIPFSNNVCLRALASRTLTFGTGSEARLKRLGSKCSTNWSTGIHSSSTTAYKIKAKNKSKSFVKKTVFVTLSYLVLNFAWTFKKVHVISCPSKVKGGITECYHTRTYFPSQLQGCQKRQGSVFPAGGIAQQRQQFQNWTAIHYCQGQTNVQNFKKFWISALATLLESLELVPNLIYI